MKRHTLIAVNVFALLGCMAWAMPARAADDEAAKKLVEYYRRKGNVPPTVQIEVKTVEPAKIKGAKSDTLAVGGRSVNFLLSDGERLFAHCSTRLSYIERRAPFTKARLKDADVEVDFSQVTTPSDRVAVIATLPLTVDEQWTDLSAGELAVFHQGRRV